MPDGLPKRVFNGGFAKSRKPDPHWTSGKVPGEPEVLKDKKTPKGALEFWKFVIGTAPFAVIKDISPMTEHGKGCAKSLNVVIKKLGMEHMLKLGAYYAKNWMALKKAYNWQYPASPVQFCRYLDKIDFCMVNGIPLNPVDRVGSDESYEKNPLDALKKSLEEPNE